LIVKKSRKTCFIVTALALLFLAFTVDAADPPPPTPKPPAMPPIDARLQALEDRVAAIEAKLGLPAPKPVASIQTLAAPRTFSGHTHTCSKGHQWDHTMDNGTHRCPICVPTADGNHLAGFGGTANGDQLFGIHVST
jgi:hypothetical protein